MSMIFYQRVVYLWQNIGFSETPVCGWILITLPEALHCRVLLPQGQTDSIIKINLSGPVGFHLHGRYRVEPVF
jgi:hypothetical protein